MTDKQILFFDMHPQDSRVVQMDDTANTVSARYGTGGGNTPIVLQKAECEQMSEEYVVRRLMPVECARLQGFPDDWCEGIKHSDAAEYKLWGNGMALPCALYVMEGIKELIDETD